MNKYTDLHVYNIAKELAPNAEIELLRYHKGKKLDHENFATFTVNGNYGWMRLSEISNTYRRFGHPGVVDRIAKFVSGMAGVDLKQGVYDESALSEYKKRRAGQRADALEFAMKSAGSSDEEIYEALKDG